MSYIFLSFVTILCCYNFIALFVSTILLLFATVYKYDGPLSETGNIVLIVYDQLFTIYYLLLFVTTICDCYSITVIGMTVLSQRMAISKQRQQEPCWKKKVRLDLTNCCTIQYAMCYCSNMINCNCSTWHD